jgi:hypothetical protein
MAHSIARFTVRGAMRTRGSSVVLAERALSQPLSISAKLDTLANELPYYEVVAYPKKSMKWSTSDVKKYSNGFAAGLIEEGFGPGDVLAVWMPHDTAETLIAKLAGARIGLKVVLIDVSISDPEQLRKIFNETKAKGLIYDPEAMDRHNTDVLTEVMPELKTFESEYGGVFRSRAVPSMKYLIHTGLELVKGAQNYKFLMVHNSMPSLFPPLPPKDAPLSVSYGADGAAGPVFTQEKAMEGWEDVKNILNKKHMSY